MDDMKNIIDPRDNDVLCGRGGAALRHPGNQCYRRLVNLNKSLYITCLKTEKLKISRSIVAAIREQNGRFLERDAKAGVWNDIGDKKAIEKTSQALRERANRSSASRWLKEAKYLQINSSALNTLSISMETGFMILDSNGYRA